MTFDEVIGQADAKARLAQLIDEDRVPHAILLCGPSGCGKMAMALAFASRLLGDSPLLRHWGHPDLHFTFPTIKRSSMGSDHQPVSNDYISEWRELLSHGPYFTFEQWMSAMKGENQQAIITGAESDELSRKLSMRPSQGGYKISIIWLPERMNTTSANKLLKLLEEPPQRTVFIMVCEAPEQLLETIRSRTQRIDFPPLEENAVAAALRDGCGLQEEDARLVAHAAGGSFTKALAQVTSDAEQEQNFDMFVLLMRLCYMRKVKDLQEWAQQMAGWGRERQKGFLEYAQRMVRENFVYNFRLPELNYMSRKEADFAVRFARFINERNVIGISEEISAAQRDIAQNVNARMVFFDFALKMIVLLIQ